jgi:hypothetical protein
MIALLRFTAAAISALAMSAWAHAAPQPTIQPATVDAIKPRLTVLYDAFGKASDMQKDWGYSALVEAGGKRITIRSSSPTTRKPKAWTWRPSTSSSCRTVTAITWAACRMS